MNKWVATAGILLSSWCMASHCVGATAEETLVVANRRMSNSEEIALYYMHKRNIPANHLLLTLLTTDESMSRNEYDRELKKPVLEKIEALRPERIEAVVLIYGVPLVVRAPEPDVQDIGQPQDARHRPLLEGERHQPEGSNKSASVDSELALAKAGDYTLSGWIMNPYFAGFQNRELQIGKDKVLLVCRLDGPDSRTVRRLIDDSLAAEKTGLTGIGYFDARWPPPKENAKGLVGYQLYDASLYKAAKAVALRMPVKVEETEALFQPGSCPKAALYAGWYSLGHYVDSFSWVKGAVGYHIASAECTTLRDPAYTGWCVQMLQHGVAATIGPVNEPYVQGFPLPELFFKVFTEGYFNLGESYLISLPYLSWQMVLVGDPLYHPFSPASKH